MSVEKETVDRPFAVGECSVPKIVRQKNGQWFVEFFLRFRIKIDENREINVDRIVSVQAGAQRGRKKRGTKND